MVIIAYPFEKWKQLCYTVDGRTSCLYNQKRKNMPMKQKSVPLEDFKEVNDWDTVIFLYKSALKQIQTKIDILNDEFQNRHKYNPIEHVKARIKTPESIIKKLKRYDYESSVENMVLYINDIAGIRITCSFTSDIYKIADLIANQNDLTVLSVQDYIKNPKKSGYRSYHMLVTVPVFLSDVVVDTKVEIQIRTVAQDFWATLEHKMHYKFEGEGPDYISRELRECAGFVTLLDEKMEQLNIEIQKYGDKQNKS